MEPYVLRVRGGRDGGCGSVSEGEAQDRPQLSFVRALLGNDPLRSFVLHSEWFAQSDGFGHICLCRDKRRDDAPPCDNEQRVPRLEGRALSAETLQVLRVRHFRARPLWENP